METTELNLKNYNNCLACDSFIYIHFAPKGPIPEKDLEKVYYTKNGDHEFYSRIVDVQRFKFSRMPTIATLPATGMEAHEWCAWWLEQFPQTQEDTEMAVYYYKKVGNVENGG